MFDTVERTTLKPLPEHPWKHTIWKRGNVHLDCHVEFERRYYSVPYALVDKTVELRITERAVEILYRVQPLAARLRGERKGQFTTDAAHRSTSHQSVIELSHERLPRHAEATAAAIRGQAYRRNHCDETFSANQVPR